VMVLLEKVVAPLEKMVAPLEEVGVEIGGQNGVKIGDEAHVKIGGKIGVKIRVVCTGGVLGLKPLPGGSKIEKFTLFLGEKSSPSLSSPHS